jgi:hypothetical protein
VQTKRRCFAVLFCRVVFVNLTRNTNASIPNRPLKAHLLVILKSHRYIVYDCFVLLFLIRKIACEFRTTRKCCDGASNASMQRELLLIMLVLLQFHYDLSSIIAVSFNQLASKFFTYRTLFLLSLVIN